MVLGESIRVGIGFWGFRTFQCKHSASDSNQSSIWSLAQTDGTGYWAVVIRTLKNKYTVFYELFLSSFFLRHHVSKAQSQFKNDWLFRKHLPVSFKDFLSISPIKWYPSRIPCLRRNHNLKRNSQPPLKIYPGKKKYT